MPPATHPTAMLSGDIDLADDVQIGPGCVLTGPVTLGPGVRLIGNVYLSGPVRIGAGTILYPFACVGFPGQDFKFKPGSPTAGVVIGEQCILREHSTVHASTGTQRPTRVGDRVFMMVSAHVAHDARVGNNVVMVNGTALGGHVDVADGVTLGGGAMVHQHGRVGRLAFLGGGSTVTTDVPPFLIAIGRNALAGPNLVGLRRAGFPREHITRIRDAYRDVFRAYLPRPEMVRVLEEMGRDCPPVLEMARFVAETKRSICPPGRWGSQQDAADAIS